VHEELLALFDGVRLTPTQRRIAQCLLERGARAAYLSSGEVAELARVSQPSVTRFAMALGYDGYPALRKAIREVGDPDPARHTGDRRPTGTTDVTVHDNEFQHALRGEVRTLARLADRLADGTNEHAMVAVAAKLLADSRPLPVLGIRSAAPLAGYFGYFAAKVHPDVRVLDHGGTLLDDRLDQARTAGATALLAVVLPRYPREALDALREARAVGLSVVVLTDSPVGPAAGLADVALTAPVGSRLVFDLQTGPMALAMVLLQAICDVEPERAQARLEEFEASAARRGVFVA
jgi:DNA-binding MurR/RpiR family transcriptional regulator